MTQEDKELLLKDLSARLPYGVKILQGDVVMETLQSICKVGDNDYTVNPITNDMYNGFHIEQVKPYLRPMSSMTEEEKKDLKSSTCPFGTGYFNEKYLICPLNHLGEQISYEFMSGILDWLNKNHFDYRGLIEKRLALEAPEGMYKED